MSKTLAKPKASNWRPTGKPANPIRPTRNPNLCDTKQQRKLLKAADRILAKAGYFHSEAMDEQVLVEADACGTHGLRPTWHGRAS